MKISINQLADKFTTKCYESGEILLNPGEKPEYLFYLRSGHVRRFINSVEGKELTIHIFEAGTVFPLPWALYEEIPDFSLVALSKVEVSLLPKEDYIKFLQENPKELMEVTIRLSRGIEGMAKRVEILSFEKADKRLSSMLAYLSRHLGNQLKFTHEDLAALTGLSRERVSIEMKELKDKKIVSYQRGVVFVNDSAKLSQL